MGRSPSFQIATLCSVALALSACRPSAFDALVGNAERDGAVLGGDASAIEDASTTTPGAPDAGGERDSSAAGSGGGAAGSAMDAGLDSGAPADDAGPNADDAATADDAGPPSCMQAAERSTVRVTATDVGAVTIPNRPDALIGPSARVGDRMLWIVSETTLWTEPDVSLPALPEATANSPVVPPDAVPPELQASVASIVPVNEREALIYFHSRNSFLPVGGPGLARIGIDEIEADVIHAAGELLPGTSGMPWVPMFNTSAFVHEEEDGRYVYVYACNPKPGEPAEQLGGPNEGPCRLARVELDRAEDGAAYRYWSGSAWVADVYASAIVITRAWTTLSVAYNRYLQAFLAVNSESTGNQIALRWAERPEGPWRPLDQIETMASTSTNFTHTFGAVLRPALSDRCDTTLYLTYVLPIDVPNPGSDLTARFESRAMRVELD